MKGYEVMGKKLHCIQRKPETDSGNGKPTVLSAVKEREQEQWRRGRGGRFHPSTRDKRWHNT